MLLLVLAIGCGPWAHSGAPSVPVVNDPHRVPDVNGDGLADIVVPVRDPDGGSGERAHVAIFFGPADGTSPPLLVPIDETALLPSYTTFVGDVDGDGTSDVVYSEYGVGGSDTPIVLLGGPNGPVADAGVVLANPGGDTEGSRVFRVGDLDADGLDDVIVLRSWTLAVHYGGGGIGGAPDVVWQESAMPSWYTPPAGMWTGQRLGDLLALGDVTGDGRDDVLVWWYGLRDSDNTFIETYAFVIPGPCDGAVTWIPANDLFPMLPMNHNVEVLSMGDVDGDGLVDLAVSPPTTGAGYSSAGWVWSEQGVDITRSSDPVGDLDGDGFGDVVRRGALETLVFSGSLDGFPAAAEPSWIFPAPDGVDPVNLESWRYGQWGGGVGDVDGDGFDDTIVGSDVDLWLWHGGPRGGRKKDLGTELFTDYMEPYGVAVRAEAP